MKVIIKMLFLIVVTMCVTTSAAQTREDQKKAKKDAKAYAKTLKKAEKDLEKIQLRFGKWNSQDLDSMMIAINHAEAIANHSNDSSIRDGVDKALAIFQNRLIVMIDSFQAVWGRYTEMYQNIETKTFNPFMLSGSYTTIPRINEILNTKISRNGVSKNYSQVLPESVELAKGEKYFLRGDSMVYHQQNPIWKSMSYYEGDFKYGNQEEMIESLKEITEGFMLGRKGFQNAKPIRTEGNRRIYSADIASRYMSKRAALRIVQWLSAAVRNNIAWRHARQWHRKHY
jgi:hypothetical protein